MFQMSKEKGKGKLDRDQIFSKDNVFNVMKGKQSLLTSDHVDKDRFKLRNDSGIALPPLVCGSFKIQPL